MVLTCIGFGASSSNCCHITFTDVRAGSNALLSCDFTWTCKDQVTTNVHASVYSTNMYAWEYTCMHASAGKHAHTNTRTHTFLCHFDFVLGSKNCSYPAPTLAIDFRKWRLAVFLNVCTFKYCYKHYKYSTLSELEFHAWMHIAFTNLLAHPQLHLISVNFCMIIQQISLWYLSDFCDM